jgi:F0F1-type ATP synthase epsilon subunit
MAQPTQQPQTQPQTKAPAQETLSAEKIHLIVRNRTQILFNENVKSVSSRNDTGVFDVLPEHANFISLITSPLSIRRLNGQKHEITFANGLLKVKDNEVRCYIDLISK